MQFAVWTDLEHIKGYSEHEIVWLISKLAGIRCVIFECRLCQSCYLIPAKAEKLAVAAMHGPHSPVRFGD